MIGTKRVTVLALIAMTFAAAVLLAEERMRAGLWEVTTTLDGKQSGVGSNCYTPAMVELANMPANMMREATEKSVTKGGHCTLNDFKLDGNRVSMTTSCGGRQMLYQSSYSGETFETLVTSNEAGVKKVISMKGRRTGDCK